MIMGLWLEDEFYIIQCVSYTEKVWFEKIYKVTYTLYKEVTMTLKI